MGWSDDIKLASEIEPKLNELIAGKRIERVEWHDGHGDVLRLHLVDGNVVTIRTKFDLLTKRERDQYKLQIEISTEAERRAERSERWKSHKPKLVATNTVLGGMEKQRDPKMDPQVGDKIYRITPSTGLRRSRQVVARVNNDISYLTHDGKQKKCWIGTWMEWAVNAEVEPPGVLGVSPKEVQTLNAGIDDLAKKVTHERRKS
jgi:hypothetical protein